MEMTFEDGMQESMLPVFHMYADDDGTVRWKKDDEPVPTFNGHEPLDVDEIGGFIDDPQHGTILLRDNFSDICDYEFGTTEPKGELLSHIDG